MGRSRHLRPPDGVILHRLHRFDDRVLWQLSSPRLRPEDAVLLAASAARDDLAAVAVLTDACGAGISTGPRLRDRLRELTCLPRRRWLLGVLDDVADGTNSVLEHGYLVRVERPHGLPVGERQRPVRDERAAFRDVRDAAVGVIVELDGHAFHRASSQRAADLQRDLVSAAAAARRRCGWAISRSSARPA